LTPIPITAGEQQALTAPKAESTQRLINFFLLIPEPNPIKDLNLDGSTIDREKSKYGLKFANMNKAKEDVLRARRQGVRLERVEIEDFTKPSRGGIRGMLGFGVTNYVGGTRGIKDNTILRYGHTRLVKPRGRRIVGMGIAPTEETYKEFGRYLLYLPALRKNILHIKFKSFVDIPNLPKREISEDLKDLIDDIIEHGKLNKRMYDRLAKDDKHYFNHVTSKCKIDDVLNISDETHKQEREEMKRFKLVKGIVQAGNNSPEVLQELKEFLIKFGREGVLNKNQVNDILADLLVVF